MQSSNADGDILVTPVGITISVREEQPKKAWEAISVIAFGKEAQLPAVYAEEVNPAVIEDLSMRVFSRLLVNGMIIPVKGTKYYRKITDKEMQAAKKAYLAAQEEVNQEAQNGGTTISN